MGHSVSKVQRPIGSEEGLNPLVNYFIMNFVETGSLSAQTCGLLLELQEANAEVHAEFLQVLSRIASPNKPFKDTVLIKSNHITLTWLPRSYKCSGHYQ